MMGAQSRQMIDAAAMANPEKVRTISLSEDNQALRANFGLPDWTLDTFLKPGGLGRRIFALMFLSMTPFLKTLFFIIQKLPWKLKHSVTTKAWKIWLALHCLLPHCISRRGISDKMSAEAHALHNVMWWSRLFPAPIWTMRFALSQLSTNAPPSGERTEWIDSAHTPGLRSSYLHLTPASEEKPRVLFWAFGGAFISGDVAGNIGLAEKYARQLGCDAFVVDMRLCPEHHVQDAVLDLYRGYQQLLERVPAENIVMLGISSGGGSCLRTLQLAAADEATRLEYFGDRRPLPPALPQPAGAILLGAFVDYTRITDSMQKNATYDWVVSPSVLETVLEKRDVLCESPENVTMCSPLYQSMEGLCPLFVSVSEHECLIDEDKELAARASQASVDVELSTVPFQCHVFQLLSAYLPEAAQEEAKICSWVRSRGGIWS